MLHKWFCDRELANSAKFHFFSKFFLVKPLVKVDNTLDLRLCNERGGDMVQNPIEFYAWVRAGAADVILRWANNLYIFEKGDVLYQCINYLRGE